MKYLQGHRSRVEGKEITGSTLKNNIRQGHMRISLEFQKLYPQAIRAYQLIPQT
ncbi:MAG: hypothetical protein WBZ20_15260 [Nitrososphaeraceae archaeon]